MPMIASSELYDIAKLAIDVGYPELGVALLEHLLEHLPSHVAGRCLLGERFVELERWEQAQEHFGYPLTVDPLSLPALRGMGHLDLAQGSNPGDSEYLQRAWVFHPYDAETRRLLGRTLDDASPLTLARILSASSLHEEALPYYEMGCDQGGDQLVAQPVLASLLSEASWRAGRTDIARPLLERLVDEHPTWIRPRLILADIALDQRDDALGVALLHDAQSLDCSWVVARELFGMDERYDSVMVRSLEVPGPETATMDSAPTVLRHLLGAEPLLEPPAATKTSAEWSWLSSSPDRHQKGQDWDIVAARSGQTADLASTRDVPMWEAPVDSAGEETTVRLILSSRDRLISRYGEAGHRELDARLSELCEAASRSTGDEVIKVYVDDDSCLDEFGLTGVDPSDAQQVSRLVEQLGSALKQESRELRSLLIIGGDSVIPFHRLANPADDEDAEVLSDWPYAAADGSSLLSRLSVGRLPDGQPSNPEMLLQLVDNAIAHHNAFARLGKGNASRRWVNPVTRLFRSGQGSWSSVGYSAEIWAEASRSVFEVIGDADKLQVSPPFTDYDFLSAYEEIRTLGYFNLHGFRGSPYWYGHGESEHGSPLLPIALTPLSVSWANADGAVIYSEACYGAQVENECGDGSIALSFLGNGALGFIGSTAMSYGSLAPPLSGADLLGRHLWEGVVAGLPIGCALRRARSAFIQAVASEHGYLDGEDQKALLSFVLYGDPSLRLEAASKPLELETQLEVACPPLACCSRMKETESVPLAKDVQQQLQRSVPFLRTNGLEGHPLILCRVDCSGENCASSKSSCAKEREGGVTELMVTSQQRVVSKGAQQLRQVVKVTVNTDGKVMKVVMSRGGTRVDRGSWPK